MKTYLGHPGSGFFSRLRSLLSHPITCAPSAYGAARRNFLAASLSGATLSACRTIVGPLSTLIFISLVPLSLVEMIVPS